VTPVPTPSSHRPATFSPIIQLPISLSFISENWHKTRHQMETRNEAEAPAHLVCVFFLSSSECTIFRHTFTRPSGFLVVAIPGASLLSPLADLFCFLRPFRLSHLTIGSFSSSFFFSSPFLSQTPLNLILYPSALQSRQKYSASHAYTPNMCPTICDSSRTYRLILFLRSDTPFSPCFPTATTITPFMRCSPVREYYPSTRFNCLRLSVLRLPLFLPSSRRHGYLVLYLPSYQPQVFQKVLARFTFSKSLLLYGPRALPPDSLSKIREYFFFYYPRIPFP